MSQPATPSNSASPALGSVAQRLVSLDAFRGTTMALMVLVNNSGDWSHTYAPLSHSTWNGWTITDVVFPSFLWIVGVAITLSLGGRLARGVAKSRLMLQVLRRAAILYALGVVGYLLPNFDFGTMRLLGVLQRIAICYLIASAIYLYAPRIRTQILWIVSLLVGYWLIMTLIPVPGYGAGRLDVDGNLAHYVNRIVLGHHNYAFTKTWDPEGIVSTLPSIATALFGILAGHLLRLSHDLDWKTTRLFFAGNALIALGLICDIWLPINKALWTSLLLALHGGPRFRASGRLYLSDRRPRLQAPGPAVRDLRHERHHHLYALGVAGHRARRHPLARRRGPYFIGVLAFRPLFRAPRLALQCLAAVGRWRSSH